MRAHKYGARKTEYKGEMYDSAAEAKDAFDLDALVANGEIAAWTRGTPYCLSGCESTKRTERIEYVPDFEVWITPGSVDVLVDRKGMVTPVFRIKQKMFKNVYPEKVLLVVKSGTSIRQALQQHQAPPAPKARIKAAA